jgi:hypothetical protein
VEFFYRRRSGATQHHRTNPNHQTDAAQREKECADALQQGEEEAGSGDYTSGTDTFAWDDLPRNVSGMERLRRRAKHPALLIILTWI